jgi:transcriptional regulator with XRE-family HTH domain
VIIEKKFTQVNTKGVNILSIGERFKEERDKKSISQDALSRILLTSRKTIVNWEADISAPDARQLGLLFANGFDIHYIVTGNRIPLFSSLSEAKYLADEVKRLITAFNNADDNGRKALMAVATLAAKDN